MWIFSSEAFLSIVRNTNKPNTLIVRSRFRGHIEKVFPNAHVTEDPTRDYRFRAELPIKEVSRVIGKLLSEICYDNFKNSLDMNDEKYLDCCLDVYDAVLMNSETNLIQFAHLRRELNEA